MLQRPLFDSKSTPAKQSYSGMPDTDFADFLTETDKFITSNPHILELIEDDLDAHALDKKRERLNDRNWEIKQKLIEEGREEEIDLHEIEEDKMSLKQGRPRTSAYVVFIGIVCSGYHENGPVSRSFQDLMYESPVYPVFIAPKRRRFAGSEDLLGAH